MKIEEKIKELQPTPEEYKIYDKVKMYFNLNDLKNFITGDYDGEQDRYTKKELKIIDDNYDVIVDIYDDLLSEYNDWSETLYDAIDRVLDYND